MTPFPRRALLGLVAVLIASLLAGCGPGANEPGGLEGQVLGMLSPTEQPVLLRGAVVAISGPGGSQTALTGGDGRYRFDNLPPGGYGMAVSYTGEQATGTPLQPEERRFIVSPAQDETISVVLLAEGITPPPTPPPAPTTTGEGQPATGGVGGGLMANPFFWYFLFNRPFDYGYGRPPVVVGPGGGGPIIINNEQPSRSTSGRPYTEYGPEGTTSVRTKPVPEVTSRGSTRPGASGGTTGGSGSVRPPSPSNPVATPAVRPPRANSGADDDGTGSRGVTRPGSSGPSVSPPSARPPAVRPPSGGRRR
jgi:hypothetical protein